MHMFLSTAIFNYGSSSSFSDAAKNFENSSGTRNTDLEFQKNAFLLLSSFMMKEEGNFYALLLLQKWSKNLFSTIYTSIKRDIVKKASYFCYFVHSVSYIMTHEGLVPRFFIFIKFYC